MVFQPLGHAASKAHWGRFNGRHWGPIPVNLSSVSGRAWTDDGTVSPLQNEGLHQFEEQPVQNLFPELQELPSK